VVRIVELSKSLNNFLPDKTVYLLRRAIASADTDASILFDKELKKLAGIRTSIYKRANIRDIWLKCVRYAGTSRFKRSQ
jgi:hypothetical protein